MQIPPSHKVKQFLGLLIVIFGYAGMVYFCFLELKLNNSWPFDIFFFFMIIIGIGTYYLVSGHRDKRRR